MKWIRTVFPLLVVIAVAVPAFAQTANAKLGKAAYTKNCATCHGDKGEGKPAIAKLMKIELRHLGSKEVQAGSDAELGKVVLEGKGKMKPSKTMKDADLSNLLAYMRTLVQK